MTPRSRPFVYTSKSVDWPGFPSVTWVALAEMTASSNALRVASAICSHDCTSGAAASKAIKRALMESSTSGRRSVFLTGAASPGPMDLGRTFDLGLGTCDTLDLGLWTCDRPWTLDLGPSSDMGERFDYGNP